MGVVDQTRDTQEKNVKGAEMGMEMHRNEIWDEIDRVCERQTWSLRRKGMKNLQNDSSAGAGRLLTFVTWTSRTGAFTGKRRAIVRTRNAAPKTKLVETELTLGLIQAV